MEREPSVLFNESSVEDEISLLSQIETFCLGIGMESIRVDTEVLDTIVLDIKTDFPHEAGLEKSSAFKKVANFLCFFIAMKPIRSAIPDSAGKIAEFDINVVVGLDIALNSLYGAMIHSREKVSFCIVKEHLALSDHSYYDMLEMLSAVTPAPHFHMLAILLEQITYKTNKDCQYKDLIYG